MVGFKDLPQPSISEDFMLSIVETQCSNDWILMYTYMSKLQNPKRYLHSGRVCSIFRVPLILAASHITWAWQLFQTNLSRWTGREFKHSEDTEPWTFQVLEWLPAPEHHKVLMLRRQMVEVENITTMCLFRIIIIRGWGNMQAEDLKLIIRKCIVSHSH